jgi:hypothetical protein
MFLYRGNDGQSITLAEEVLTDAIRDDNALPKGGLRANGFIESIGKTSV